MMRVKTNHVGNIKVPVDFKLNGNFLKMPDGFEIAHA
jgi:hypothetical protein